MIASPGFGFGSFRGSLRPCSELLVGCLLPFALSLAFVSDPLLLFCIPSHSLPFPQLVTLKHPPFVHRQRDADYGRVYKGTRSVRPSGSFGSSLFVSSRLSLCFVSSLLVSFRFGVWLADVRLFGLFRFVFSLSSFLCLVHTLSASFVRSLIQLADARPAPNRQNHHLQVEVRDTTVDKLGLRAGETGYGEQTK
ncbi:hypothetical protein C8J56DRAFT_8131 [Mycena floridula]|nr:hypothetical protein C8J56DRAFT_8131 [Mycena floridula]